VHAGAAVMGRKEEVAETYTACRLVAPARDTVRPAGRVRARGVVQRPTPLPGLSYGLVT
jgi:hypothetical protein